MLGRQKHPIRHLARDKRAHGRAGVEAERGEGRQADENELVQRRGGAEHLVQYVDAA